MGSGVSQEGGPGQRRGTCAGMPVLSQLVALAAVALVGAIDVGALLAAALGLTLVHVCRQTSRRSLRCPSSPEGQGPAHPEPYLERPSVPASLRADGEPEAQKKARSLPETCSRQGQ